MKAVNFGIDLGTTNSLIAKYENGEVMVFKNPIGFKETLPSVVAFRQDRILVGDKAREYLNKDAVNVFSSFKRKMGTDEKYYVVNLDENVTPIELSTYVLKELKQFVKTGDTPKAAVITVPASFDSVQSNATLKAGEAAGFLEVFLLQEPIAASLAYFNQKTVEEQNGFWLVYDFGGGTFDAALVKVSETEMKIIDNEGNNFLGGVDFDFLIIKHLIVPVVAEKLGITDFEEQLTEKFGTYEKLYYQLMYLAEEAKKELSIAEQTSIEFQVKVNDVEHEFYIPITRQELNTILLPKVNETIECVLKIIKQNNLQPHNINEIILVGGSTYMPLVKEQLALQTGIKINSSIDPTTAIAVGAAYYASNKMYNDEGINSDDNNFANQIINSAFGEGYNESLTDISIQLSYNNSSRDSEELLLMSCDGSISGCFYRITRQDGGFDTGLIPLKAKKSEFLTLLPNVTNFFTLRIFDSNQVEFKSLAQEIHITHGKFSIDGQPLPHDICIEVDDVENNTTKLEVIFERNALLPLKRTLYRTISKNIKKNSDDEIVISILEGDRNARPSSNLPIGHLAIKGKELDFDVVKGSDIEIQLQMSESRILTVTIYLVMTKQEFKNVFSLSEKNININRLIEQTVQLKEDLTYNLREFQDRDEKLLEIQVSNILAEVRAIEMDLSKLKPNDNSDRKYVYAERLWKISQEADKMGGNERLQELIERYETFKEEVAEMVENVDMNKDTVREAFNRFLRNDSIFLKSKNISVIENGLKQLWDVYYLAESNTIANLVIYFTRFKALKDSDFTNAKVARSMIKNAEDSLQQEKYADFRRNIFAISNLINRFDFRLVEKDFKGTGIG